MAELNKVNHDNWLNNGLPDKSVNLIIADPPYFKVKGNFDFVWPSFEAYLEDVELWAKECKRLLTDNGTLFWYGHAKKIAYAQIIFDKYFNLENNLVWRKTSCQTMKNSPESMRTFAPITERILMYSNGVESYEYVNYKDDSIFVFQPILDWFVSEFKKSGLTRKEVDKACNTSNVTQYWFLKRNFQIPTYEKYKILQELSKEKAFRKEYEELRKEYEELRKEYEELRRPFNNFNGLQYDVLDYSQETHITKDYDHPTKKPESLTMTLIMTCSRANDTVLIPFSGSGTEAAMCQRLGLKFYAFDIEEKYVEMGNKRILKELNT